MAKTNAPPPDPACDRLLDRIVEIWNVPPEERDERDRQHSFSRDRDLTREDVFAALIAEFGADELSGCMNTGLAAVADLCFRGEVPDRRTMFVAGCILDLIDIADELRVSSATVRKVVASFPVAIWYRPVGALVQRHLDRAQLSELLIDCLEAQTSEFLRLSLLEAVVMYMPKAKAAAAAAHAMGALETKLVELSQEANPELSKAAARATEALRSLDRAKE